MTAPIIFAIPKGRILDEALPLMQAAGIEPEAAFFDKESRSLMFATNDPGVQIIRVRAFDVATFVAHGAAQAGIVGSDVIDEFDYSELYAPVDLDIGHCRISVAEPAELAATDDPRSWSHVRLAAAFILSGTMAVAYFQFHQPGGLLPAQNRGELAALYCFVFLFIAARGAGRFGIDKR